MSLSGNGGILVNNLLIRKRVLLHLHGYLLFSLVCRSVVVWLVYFLVFPPDCFVPPCLSFPFVQLLIFLVTLQSRIFLQLVVVCLVTFFARVFVFSSISRFSFFALVLSVRLAAVSLLAAHRRILASHWLIPYAEEYSHRFPLPPFLPLCSRLPCRKLLAVALSSRWLFLLAIVSSMVFHPIYPPVYFWYTLKGRYTLCL